jgi:hypothetical protein
MFTPILSINTHLVSEILVQHTIEPFYPVNNLWVKCRVKKEFRPYLLEQMPPKAYCKLGFSIIYNELKHSMVPNPHVKKLRQIESCSNNLH